MKKIYLNPVLYFLLILGITSCKSLKDMSLPLDTLTSGSWELSELFGSAVQAADYMKGLPNMAFSEDGKFTGSTGCNQFTGDYSLEGAALKVNPGAMSKMACPGDGEALFLNAISKVAGAKIDGDKLTLLDEGKKSLMKLVKSK
jgi:heat shock protein HslJ